MPSRCPWSVKSGSSGQIGVGGNTLGDLGVWAEEGFENSEKNFDLSESLRLRHFDAGKGLVPLKTLTFQCIFFCRPDS